tara:strand:- start:163 stop:357 length:195 start_codon:yes stop_codon:yes gene_type:complete
MVKVGDLVYIVATRQPTVHPKTTKGVVFSQLDENWFRIYISWDDHTRVQDYPRWMLKKVTKKVD